MSESGSSTDIMAEIKDINRLVDVPEELII